MRFSVVFDSRAESWLVVDTHAPGRVLARHADLNLAKDAAWREEERWRQAWPFSRRPEAC